MTIHHECYDVVTQSPNANAVRSTSSTSTTQTLMDRSLKGKSAGRCMDDEKNDSTTLWLAAAL